MRPRFILVLYFPRIGFVLGTIVPLDLANEVSGPRAAPIPSPPAEDNRLPRSSDSASFLASAILDLECTRSLAAAALTSPLDAFLDLPPCSLGA